ncbi:MAG: hypothetical protein BGP07_09730 [Rhizobiales bacterium 63-22]|nr:MAG: hypothetical protein BGP07_09730 [Rhizobiales bacterium 63-22]
MLSNRTDLVAFFAQSGMTMKRIGFEADALSQRLYGGMVEAGLPVPACGDPNMTILYRLTGRLRGRVLRHKAYFISQSLRS